MLSKRNREFTQFRFGSIYDLIQFKSIFHISRPSSKKTKTWKETKIAFFVILLYSVLSLRCVELHTFFLFTPSLILFLAFISELQRKGWVATYLVQTKPKNLLWGKGFQLCMTGSGERRPFVRFVENSPKTDQQGWIIKFLMKGSSHRPLPTREYWQTLSLDKCVWLLMSNKLALKLQIVQSFPALPQ